MANYIKVLLLTKGGASFVDLENTNEGFNKALGWDDAWNTPTIRIDDVPYVIVCSDLGKVRHEPISCLGLVNLFEKGETIKEPFIVDSVIVTKFDGVDDFESLNDLDIERLKNRLMEVTTGHPDIFKTILIID